MREEVGSYGLCRFGVRRYKHQIRRPKQVNTDVPISIYDINIKLYLNISYIDRSMKL